MRRGVSLLLAAGMLVTLAGCQLAQGETGEPQITDQLIGALVTTEPLDPLGEEAVYATESDGDYTFPDVAGVSFHYKVEYSSQDNAMHTVSGRNEAVADGGVSYEVKDFDLDTGKGQNSVTLYGTVTYDAGAAPAVFYLNPVYQREDGQVYAVPDGTGASFESGNGSGELTFSQSVTINEGTEGELESTTVRAEIAFRCPAETIRLIQMNQENQEVARTEFSPGQAPETLEPEGETAYLLVENCRTGSQGETVIDREIVARGEEYLNTYSIQPSGFYHTQTTQVLWDQEGGTR